MQCDELGNSFIYSIYKVPICTLSGLLKSVM